MEFVKEKVFSGILAISILLFIGILTIGHVGAENLPPLEIPQVMDLTGPFKTESARWSAVATLLEKDINASGGIRGRQIKCTTYDTRYDIAAATSILDRIVNMEQKPPIICAYIAHIIIAGLPKMAQEGYRIPMLAPAAYEAWAYPPNWVFHFGILYAQSFGGFVDWHLKSWKQKRPIKVAFFIINSPGGRESLKVTPYFKKIGVDVVATEFTPPNPVDITQSMMRFQQTQPDFVYCIAPVGAVAKLFNETSKRKLKYKIVIPAFVTYGMLEKYVPKKVLEGHYQASAFNSPNDLSAPGVKKIDDLVKKNAPELMPIGSVDYWSAGNVLLAKDVLERAYDKFGSWDKVTGEAVYDILNNGEFSTGGITSELKFTPTRRIGNEAFKVLQYKGGKVVDASGWLPIPKALSEEVFIQKASK